jgi:hypothetical protein
MGRVRARLRRRAKLVRALEAGIDLADQRRREEADARARMAAAASWLPPAALAVLAAEMDSLGRTRGARVLATAVRLLAVGG